nr:hypothetical protein [Methylotenera mobilis]
MMRRIISPAESSLVCCVIENTLTLFLPSLRSYTPNWMASLKKREKL